MVHGDLTTSNMILRHSDGQLVCGRPAAAAALACQPPPSYVFAQTHARSLLPRATPQVLIDFGLSYSTSLAEDKAVDLYVLERAITSAHASLSGLVRSPSYPRLPAPGR